MTIWAAEWYSNNKLDGVKKHILNGDNCLPCLFNRRCDSREWIANHFGYIKERPDLQREPFGWRMPRPVKVKIVVVGSRKEDKIGGNYGSRIRSLSSSSLPE